MQGRPRGWHTRRNYPFGEEVEMRTIRNLLLSTVVLTLSAAAFAAEPTTGAASAQPAAEAAGHGDHIALAANELKWTAAPPVFNPGAQFTVVAGNPMEPGPYVVRLSMPAGYKIMPHWHPTDENVTVLGGVLRIGGGDTFDTSAGKALQVGGFALLPANMHHFAYAEKDTIVQVHGMGPFQLTYVNPADMPAQPAAAPSGK